MTDKSNVMTPAHEKWDEFCNRLEGEEGCNFHEDPVKGIVWNCTSSGAHAHKHSRAILTSMKCDVEASLEYFRKHGGYCDCEVLFNVKD
jgi:hypothetical protein